MWVARAQVAKKKMILTIAFERPLNSDGERSRLVQSSIAKTEFGWCSIMLCENVVQNMTNP
jgi:hypothetical protein